MGLEFNRLEWTADSDTSLEFGAFIRTCCEKKGIQPYVDGAPDAGRGTGEGLEVSNNKRGISLRLWLCIQNALTRRTTTRMQVTGTQRVKERENRSPKDFRKGLDKDRMVRRFVTGSMLESATIRSASLLTCVISVSRRVTLRSTAKRRQRPTPRAPDSWMQGRRKCHRIRIHARYYTCFQDAPERDRSVSGQGSLPQSGK